MIFNIYAHSTMKMHMMPDGSMMKGEMCPTAMKAMAKGKAMMKKTVMKGKTGMSHAEKVRKYMKANPGTSLATASKMVAKK